MTSLSKAALLGALLLVAVFSASASPAELYEGKRLISTGPHRSAWLTPEEILVLIRADVGFVDITNRDESLLAKPAPAALPVPSNPIYQDVVEDLISEIDMDLYEDHLTHYSSYENRYANADSGKEAVEWLHSQIQSIVAGRSGFTVQTYPTPGLKQMSIVVRVQGTGPFDDVVVLGSHVDSINMFGSNLPAPGADDDGSGSMAVLEVLRIVAESGFMPNVTTEFHFYSAEELGLIGSAHIAQIYKQQNAVVRGMLQLDMVGYSGYGKIGLIQDFTSSELNTFVAKLIDEYLDITYEASTCGYGCSDHASWNEHGYRSTFTFEAPFGKHSPYIHTPQDTVANIDFEYAREFIKLGLAFVTEMSA